MTRRSVVVLGSTGSIGTQALDVVRAHPDRFHVVGLAAGRDDIALERQATALGVRQVALFDRAAAAALRARRADLDVLDGSIGVCALAGAGVDLVVNGITGAIGLEPTLAALSAGSPV